MLFLVAGAICKRPHNASQPDSNSYAQIPQSKRQNMRLSSSKCRGRVRDEPGQPGLSMRKCRTDPWREREHRSEGTTGRVNRLMGPLQRQGERPRAGWMIPPDQQNMQLYGAPGQIHAKDTPFGDIVYQRKYFLTVSLHEIIAKLKYLSALS